jgi:hypothetical protein
MEALHQGLYLGFKGLRPIADPKIRALWHDPTLNVSRFDGAAGSVDLDSLFNLGMLLLSAGRDTAHVGKTSAVDRPLATDPGWLFFLSNGPAAAHAAYLRSLNLMVGRTAGLRSC